MFAEGFFVQIVSTPNSELELLISLRDMGRLIPISTYYTYVIQHFLQGNNI